MLSTIKVPKQASRYRPLRLNLPDAIPCCKKHCCGASTAAYCKYEQRNGHNAKSRSHVQSLRGSKPVVKPTKRPSSANGGKRHHRPAQPSSRVSNKERPSHGRRYNKYDHIKAKVAGAQQRKPSENQAKHRHPSSRHAGYAKQSKCQQASKVHNKENLPNVEAQYHRGGNYSRQHHPSVYQKVGGKRDDAAAPVNSYASQYSNAQYGNNGRYSRYGQYNNNRGGYFQNAPTRLW